MELFAVICTTCKSKLKVRDASAIGQILACPKCQAMVLIQPPPGWSEGATAAPAPQTPSASAPQHPAPAPSFADALDSKTFDDAAALLEQPASSAPAPVPAAEPPVAVPLAPAAATVAAAPPAAAVPGAEAPLPHGEWVSPQTQLLRRWLLAGSLTTAGAIGVIGVLAYAFSGGAPSPAPLAAADPPTEVRPATEPSENEVTDPAENDAPADPQEKKEPGDEPAPDADVPTPAAQTEPMPQPPAVAQDDAPLSDDTKKSDPAAPRTSLPPDLAAAPEEKDEDDSPKPVQAFNLDKTLKEFGSLIESRPFQGPAAVGEEAEPMPPAADIGMPTTDDRTEEEPLPRPAARKVDVARRLNDPLEAIEITDMPLAEFVSLMTELTTTPVSLDPQALPAIKASPESKISIKLDKTNVGEMMTKALAPLQLTYVEVTDGAPGLVVVPLAITKGELKSIKHDVSDLAPDEAQAKALVDFMTTLIAPATWSDAGGAGEITIEGTHLIVSQTPQVHYQIVLLCEKLRLARNLPTRSSYPPTVITLTPRAAQADALLDTPVTMNFVPPTRLGRVTDYIHRQTGLRVLVDWQALAEAEWNPDGEVKAGVANQPVRVFLDRLARRMGIAWRVIDPTTVELTTETALAAAPDVEVYAVGDEGAKALERARGAFGGAWPEGCLVAYDPDSKAILASMPQPQQRRLAEILKNLP